MKIFISYHRKDTKYKNRIIDILEANDIASILRNETMSAVTSPYATLGGEVWVMIDERNREMAESILNKECVSSAPYN